MSHVDEGDTIEREELMVQKIEILGLMTLEDETSRDLKHRQD